MAPPTSPCTPRACSRSSADDGFDHGLGPGRERLVQPRVAELGVADHPVEPHVRDLVHQHLAAGRGLQDRARVLDAAAVVGQQRHGERAVRERPEELHRGRRSPPRWPRAAPPASPRPPAGRPRSPGRRRASSASAVVNRPAATLTSRATGSVRGPGAPSLGVGGRRLGLVTGHEHGEVGGRGDPHGGVGGGAGGRLAGDVDERVARPADARLPRQQRGSRWPTRRRPRRRRRGRSRPRRG